MGVNGLASLDSQGVFHLELDLLLIIIFNLLLLVLFNYSNRTHNLSSTKQGEGCSNHC